MLIGEVEHIMERAIWVATGFQEDPLEDCSGRFPGRFKALPADRVVGQEPVQYVANINKYYVAYKLLMESRERRERTKARMAPAA